MNGGSVTPSNPLPDGKYKYDAGGGQGQYFALMTAADGVIKVYAASEAEGNNINVYGADGAFLGNTMTGAILNSIAAVAANYDNFVRVERITMAAGAVDITPYQTLV